MRSPEKGRSTTRILVVEDNRPDVLLLRYVLEQEPEWQTDVVVAEDGEKAIEYLLSPENDKPDLVILDLNLPKRDGMEVLKVIRNSPEINRLPVIVFSSSPEEVIRSRVLQGNLRAECYITKPDEFDLFPTLAQRFRKCYEAALRSDARAASS